MTESGELHKARPILDPFGDLFARLSLLGVASPNAMRDLRRKLVWAYAWALPSREAVGLIASFTPLIEIGAGTGYWAWLLGQAGADVLAYDRNPDAPPHWCAVKEGGPECVTEHKERTLFLCWPPLGESFAADCLGAYRGECFIFIGEQGEQARTGDPEFRRILKEGFVLEQEIKIPVWPGCTDSLAIYRRRSG